MAKIYLNYVTEYGDAPSQVSVDVADGAAFTFAGEHLPALAVDGYQFKGWMLAGSVISAGYVLEEIDEDIVFTLIAKWAKAIGVYSNASGAFGFPKSFVITDDNGSEMTAVVTDEVKVFTATDNDVRTGKVYASTNGIGTGANDIPTYHTIEGKRIIKAGSEFSIPLTNLYDYTALQAIICTYNTSYTDSVAADRVVVSDALYPVNSTEAISTVEKDGINRSINLGVTNNTENKFVLRYFTYKEM